MQLNEDSAKAGYLWFRQGVWLFRRNPLGLLMMFFTAFFAMIIISYIPLLGAVLPSLLVPTVSVGFMIGCRDAVAGKPVLPSTVVGGLYLYGKGVARQLLTLGVIYTVLLTLAIAASALVDGGDLFNMLMLGATPTDPALTSSNEMLAILVMMAALVPLSMLFWFAPILTAWHEVPPHKALFFSFMTCWRNRSALLVFFLIWIAVILAVVSIVGLVLTSLDVGIPALVMIMAPIDMILGTIITCSFYASYRGSFTVPEAVSGKATASSDTLG